MNRRTTAVLLGILLASSPSAPAAQFHGQPARDPLADSLAAGSDDAAARVAASRPDAYRETLEGMIRRFDASIHSARDVPEQRRVQYDVKTLDQGLRLARIYAAATKDDRPLRRFTARRTRIEVTVLLNERRFDAAIAKLSEALAEAERLDDVWLQIITLTNQAYGQVELGQGDAALRSGERARTLAERHDLRSRALTVFNLATVHMHLGRFDASVAASKHAIDLARQLGNRMWEGNALLNLGGAYRQLGNIPAARATLEQARDVLLQTKDQLGIGRSYYALALVAGDAGDYATAVKEMELALPSIRAVDIRHSHEIDNSDGQYYNPVEEAALGELSTWYGQLNNHAKALEYAKARDTLRARRPAGGHTHTHPHPPGASR